MGTNSGKEPSDGADELLGPSAPDHPEKASETEVSEGPASEGDALKLDRETLRERPRMRYSLVASRNSASGGVCGGSAGDGDDDDGTEEGDREGGDGDHEGGGEQGGGGHEHGEGGHEKEPES